MKEEFFIDRDAWATDVIRGTDLIVYGTVESVLPENEAVIAVRHVLKGQAGQTIRVRGLVAPAARCGTTFTVGEAFVYFVRSEQINLCSKYVPSEQMLRAVEMLVLAPK